MKTEFDYIIVGAGSAGCVMANRLSADPAVTVCLVEAGTKAQSIFIRMPAALTFPIESKTYNWMYASGPEPHLNGRRIGQARGKGLGGSSSINGMVFVRGHPKDYDGWSDFGVEGWSYENCLPYFKMLETFKGPAHPLRGTDGPISVTQSRAAHVFYERFLEAGTQFGLSHAPDYNAQDLTGTHVTQATIRNGVRSSAAEGYLFPISDRKNLTVLPDTFVECLSLEGQHAVGIRVNGPSGATELRASREVILSAGTIASPQILMLSGIGSADHLRAHSIDVVADLPGVGENLQDHVVAPLRYRCDRPVSVKAQLGLIGRARLGAQWLLTKRGLGASNFFEVGAFFGTDTGEAYANMQHEFLPFLADFQDGKVVLGDGFQYFVSQMRPHSRGRLRLNGRDPRQHPSIVFNYLDDLRDVTEMLAGIRMTREMAAQGAWDEFRDATLDSDLEDASDDQMFEWLRANANTEHHPVGTCRMGTDEMAVTDALGKVHGVDGLRIVDGSIIPRIPTANIQAPIMMVAERIADLIVS
ncbi:MAG: choline dehydrogenase [Pseudomonadota bacterium]